MTIDDVLSYQAKRLVARMRVHDPDNPEPANGFYDTWLRELREHIGVSEWLEWVDPESLAEMWRAGLSPDDAAERLNDSESPE